MVFNTFSIISDLINVACKFFSQDRTGHVAEMKIIEFDHMARPPIIHYLSISARPPVFVPSSVRNTSKMIRGFKNKKIREILCVCCFSFDGSCDHFKDPQFQWSMVGRGYKSNSSPNTLNKEIQRGKRQMDIVRMPTIQRGMVSTRLGSIFYLLCDGTTTSSSKCDGISKEKATILCFHGSPRSSDEYLEVLPFLADSGKRVVIAFDTPGYGASENPSKSCSLDEISDSFLEAADSILRMKKKDFHDDNGNNNDGTHGGFITMGCLMGNFFCVSLASRYPDRVKACIMVNLYFFPQPPKMEGENPSTATEDADAEISPVPDSFVLEDDGSHLVSLHNQRKGWLDPELNFRVVHSEISYLVNRRARYAKGISIQNVSDFDFVTPAKQVKVRPILCVKGQAYVDFFDKIGYQGSQRFEEACQHLAADRDDKGRLNLKTLEGGASTLNLINQMPEEFASLCHDFMEEHGL
jgi:pimeloyl-ACP methyl ester carboxylesterase